MGKVFTSKQFIEKLKWLVNDVPNYYHSQNGTWCNYNKENGKFMMDCVVSVKGILWGFKADKNKAKGGAVYGSNGVRDFTCNGALDLCTKVSQNFNNLVPGEYLCMKGTKYNHTGIYLGNGKVFECTTAWNTRKCIISDISKDGTRSYKGVKCLKWTYHGLLNYIDYSDSSDPTPTKSIEELAQEVIAGKWGNGTDRKNRLEAAGYNYRQVQDRVNELVSGKTKKYIQLTAGVWCRLNGYGFNYSKYKVIPYGTKCELITKNIGFANGYNWDKVIYNSKTVYLPNNWNKYL